jgi:hypothetical protein
VKDIVHVDGLPTAGGSALPPEVLAGPQATVVSRLKAAGAWIAGKTATASSPPSSPPGPAIRITPPTRPGVRAAARRPVRCLT